MFQESRDMKSKKMCFHFNILCLIFKYWLGLKATLIIIAPEGWNIAWHSGGQYFHPSGANIINVAFHPSQYLYIINPNTVNLNYQYDTCGQYQVELGFLKLDINNSNKIPVVYCLILVALSILLLNVTL